MMTPHAPASCIERNLQIVRDADVAIAQSVAMAFARAAGLSSRACWEFAIAVSEAATNILKHATSGQIVLCSMSDFTGPVEFVALDRGAGIRHLTNALQDGFSEERMLDETVRLDQRRGLGLGLGAIQRLMDEVSVSNRSGGGTSVIARKHR